MSVTTDATASARPALLDREQRASIDLAIAQWVGSARATSMARQRLLALGVAPDEVESRRRAASADPILAGILRFAVTTVIARGRIGADLRRLKPVPSDALVREVLTATAQAFLNVTLAESIDATGPQPAIDMNIGDY